MTLGIYRENENTGGLLGGLGVFVKHDRKHKSGSEFSVSAKAAARNLGLIGNTASCLLGVGE